ncbi:diguanylate cyclase domain-containing protein [Calothrix sp. UHCC 0171]|uniref:GGDEF domain-containing response regulator n=1 Tax=Calothrix sp. UHCC 0171 TaxID=3110245 RepID=UPI002B21B3E4|nr:diguanylate cyclase [Calothrix sp. UHCC 0171]MEA5569746.1 diguanylate cyclase [Calothrix sp. UHCC 0171]
MDCPKILVVEDEKVLAVDIRNSLQKLGYTVPEITDSGEGAIKKVAETHPNLVLMDICLTGAVDAVQAGDFIRKNFHVPVLYLTEYAAQSNSHQNLLCDPFSYIIKPFAEKDLHIAVEMALYKHHIEKKFHLEHQHLLTVINSMGSAVIVTDTSGCMQMINPVAESLTGWKQSELIGKDITHALCLIDKDTGEEIDFIVKEVVTKGQIVTLPSNCILIAKDGREIPIGDNASPIRDRNGNITGVVLTFQDITERKEMEARLLRNAFYDALTSLPNRVLFLDRLRQAFERAKRRNNFHFAVLFLDLDGFKGINDRFGHGMGDDLLVAIAQRLHSCLRSGDTVARFGGDEFAVLLEDIKDASEASAIARRIQDTLKLPLHLNGQELITTASIGIALSANHHDEPGQMLRDADIAMYRAKQQGKANFNVF